MATLFAVLDAEGRRTRRCDKSCYGSAHDAANCRCICEGRNHGQGLVEAVATTRLIYAGAEPFWACGPGGSWRDRLYFNLLLIQQQVLDGGAPRAAHRLRVDQRDDGFTADCVCGRFRRRVTTRERTEYSRALRDAARAYEAHLKECESDGVTESQSENHSACPSAREREG